MDGMESELRQALAVLGAICAFVGALAAAFIAWLTRVNLCEASCHPPAAMEAQLVLGLVGLIPAAVLVYAVARSRWRLAAWTLAIGIVLYAAWGLLNNLTVHGSLFGG